MNADARNRAGVLFVLALALATWGLRLALPSDVSKRDQERPISYVADVVLNGHWIVQHDHEGEVASKPPLYTWIAAFVSIVSGSFSRPVWTAPALLAFVVVALAVHRFGEQRIGPGVGLLAATFFVLSPLGSRSSTLIRADTLFCALVFLAAWAGLAAREGRRSPTPFWILATLATLAKGPLGLVLATIAPLVAVPPGKGAAAWRAHLPGASTFLVVCGGWLAAALVTDGPLVYDKLIRSELVGHAIAGDGGELPFARAYMPPFYLLTRFAPWSLLAIAALAGVGRSRAAGEEERRAWRFLVGFLVGSLVLLGAAAHQRQGLVLPLLPVAALLAARSAASWLAEGKGGGRPFAAAATVATLCLPLLVYYHGVLERGDPEIVRGRLSHRLAGSVASHAGPGAPVAFDRVKTVQNLLGVHRREASVEAACELLRGERPALVATAHVDELVGRCRELGVTSVLVADVGETGRVGERLGLVGNRAGASGRRPARGLAVPLLLEWTGLVPAGRGSSHAIGARPEASASFDVVAPRASLDVENLSDRAVIFVLETRRAGETGSHRREVAPRERVRIDLSRVAAE